MRLAIFAAAAFAALASAPAHAEDSITIPVTTADVQNDAALANLYGRVEDAAKTLCSKLNYTLLPIAGAQNDCRKSVVRESIRNARIAPLSAYYTTIKEKRTAPSPSATLAAR
jgi:UrcA family protein